MTNAMEPSTPSEWVWYNVAHALHWYHQGRAGYADLYVNAALNWTRDIQRERIGMHAVPSTVSTCADLYNADPNCAHEVEVQWSWVKCKKCPGWFCY